MLTKAQKIAAYEMFLDGFSYDEIGKIFGVSAKSIYRLFGKQRQRKEMICVYPSITEWLKMHDINRTKFASELGIVRATMYNKLSGKSEFTISEAKAILSYTGLTFEEAFGQEDEHEKDS